MNIQTARLYAVYEAAKKYVGLAYENLNNWETYDMAYEELEQTVREAEGIKWQDL